MTDPGHEAPHSNRVVRAIERGFAALAVRSHGRPGLSLLIAAAVTLLLGSQAGKLTIDTDLAHLLPQSFQSVQDLEKLKQRFGGVGYVVVVGRGTSVENLKHFADEMAPKIEALPSIRYVDHRRPIEFFEDRALYFLDAPDLEHIRDRLVEREKWERRRNNPLYIDLDPGPAPSVEFPELEKKYRGEHGDIEWMTRQGDSPYYIDEKARTIVLLAKPELLASDLGYSKKIVGEVDRLLARTDFSKYGRGFEVAITGNYKKKMDQQGQVQRDLAIASAISLALVVAHLAYHFRQVSAVVLVLVPILAGLTATFGLAALLFGTLNILTAFVGAILTGLGLDHGIHLMSQFSGEVARHSWNRDTIARTFGRIGRVVLGTSLTTAVAFAAVSISEFRAFREFGVLAAAGMMLVLLAYAGMMPALLAVARRLRWRPAVPREDTSDRFGRWVVRRAVPILVVTAAVALPLTIASRNMGFDFDFAALEDSRIPSFQLDKEVNRILGYSQTPVLVLTEDARQERAVAEGLRDRKQARGKDSTIDFVASIADLVPTDQAHKREIIAGIDKVVRRIRPSWLQPEDRKRLEDVKRMTRAQPYVRADLPHEVKRQFAGPGASADQGIVLVFPAISLSDGLGISALAREVRGVRDDRGREVSASGEPMILADILAMVMGEAPGILVLVLVLDILVMWLLLGSLRDTGLAALGAWLTIPLTGGAMALLGIELNYMSMIMVPVTFGMGVEGGIHIVAAHDGTRPLWRVLGETGRAIFGSLLTGLFGFGAMLVADHPGLRSLGIAAVLALGINLVICLVPLPALLHVLDRAKARRRHAEESHDHPLFQSHGR